MNKQVVTNGTLVMPKPVGTTDHNLWPNKSVFRIYHYPAKSQMYEIRKMQKQDKITKE